MATKTAVKKKMVKRLNPAQAKMAVKAMSLKKLPVAKAPASTKFTPPGYDTDKDGK